MDGYALARALTSDPRRAGLHILALAAHAGPAVVQAAAASGMRGAVGKFDRPALLGALANLLDVHELGSHELEARVMGDMAA
jgi:two-component system chemotaxis sensor kinase CheA